MRVILQPYLCGLHFALAAVPATARDVGMVSGATRQWEHVGQCFSTRVVRVGTRLEEADGKPVPGSGSAILFDDGHDTVSYDELPAVDQSRPGDLVKLCVVALPRHCPRGDTRGIRYRGMNLRTGLSWEAADAEHMCGGA